MRPLGWGSGFDPELTIGVQFCCDAQLPLPPNVVASISP